jgi:hypothetical protein
MRNKEMEQKQKRKWVMVCDDPKLLFFLVEVEGLVVVIAFDVLFVWLFVVDVVAFWE